MAFKQNGNPFKKRMAAEDIKSYTDGEYRGNDPRELLERQRRVYQERSMGNIQRRSDAIKSGAGFFERIDPRTGEIRRLTNKKMKSTMIKPNMSAVDVSPRVKPASTKRSATERIETRQGSKLTRRQKRLMAKGKTYKASKISKRRAERAKRRAARR